MTYQVPNYSPLTTPGETRRRIWRGQEENELNGAVFQLYHEQTVIAVDDGQGGFYEEVLRDEGTVKILAGTDFLASAVDMRDPISDAVISQAAYDTFSGTGQGLYVAKYSMGRWAQEQRDVYFQRIDANAADPAEEIYGLNPSTGEYIPEP